MLQSYLKVLGESYMHSVYISKLSILLPIALYYRTKRGLHKHICSPVGGITGVFVHQLSKRRSQVGSKGCAVSSVRMCSFFSFRIHSVL